MHRTRIAEFPLTFWLQMARGGKRRVLRQSAEIPVRMAERADFLGFWPVKKFPDASSSEAAKRLGLGGLLIWLVVVAVAYFLLAKLGLQLASINPSASPIWAPTGLAFAAVILGGVRFFPA